jgi:hypothetical protein
MLSLCFPVLAAYGRLATSGREKLRETLLTAESDGPISAPSTAPPPRRTAPAASIDITAEWPEQSGLACCSLEARIV